MSLHDQQAEQITEHRGRVLNIGDRCTSCGQDTGAGSGLWVNRVPSYASAEGTAWLAASQSVGFDYLDGYLCEPCLDGDNPATGQRPACDGCGKTDMDEYACFNDKGSCLDCCGCSEHRAEDHLGSWRD
jgi:hypothetical protein